MSTLPQLQLVSDVALFMRAEGAKVLLVRYRRAAYDTGWYLPDVLLNVLEHPEEGAKRALREQLGVGSREISLSHIESFNAEGAWHLAFHYKAVAEKDLIVHPSADVADLRWFPVTALPEQRDTGSNGWALKTIEHVLATNPT